MRRTHRKEQNRSTQLLCVWYIGVLQQASRLLCTVRLVYSSSLESTVHRHAVSSSYGSRRTLPLGMYVRTRTSSAQCKRSGTNSEQQQIHTPHPAREARGLQQPSNDDSETHPAPQPAARPYIDYYGMSGHEVPYTEREIVVCSHRKPVRAQRRPACIATRVTRGGSDPHTMRLPGHGSTQPQVCEEISSPLRSCGRSFAELSARLTSHVSGLGPDYAASWW